MMKIAHSQTSFGIQSCIGIQMDLFMVLLVVGDAVARCARCARCVARCAYGIPLENFEHYPSSH